VFTIAGYVETSIPASNAAELVKDTRTITLPFSISAGDFIEISANDPTLAVPGDEAAWYYCIGQVVRVKQVNGSTITFDDKLRLNYNTLTPKVAKMHAISNVGFENFKVSNQGPTGSANFSSNFNFGCSTDCWLIGIESQGSGLAHIVIESSANIEINGSYFHESQYYGDGGHGYGVLIGGHTSSCLVENNIFSTLRHAMIVAGGANGNVFGYNYSRDVYSSWEPDISIHGHFPFANLFEGNSADFAQADLVWGVNGPYNVFFRNALNRMPTVMCWGIDSKEGGIRIDHQSGFRQHFYLLGNAVRDVDCVFNNHKNALYFDWSDLDLEGGNTGLDQVTDGSFNNGERTSYYKGSRPAFISTSYTWPPLGCKFSGNTPSRTIPAKDRWNAGGVITVPSSPLYCAPSSVNFENTMIGKSSIFILPVVSGPRSSLTIFSVTNNQTIFQPNISVPLTINENDTLKATTTFKPFTFGSFADTITIISNCGIGKFFLSGSSPYPTLTVSKSAIDFHSAAKNVTTRDTVKVMNHSINTLIVDSIYTKTSAYIVDRTHGTAGTDTFKIEVSFTPTTLSWYSDTLYLRNNSQAPVVKIPLSGIGIALPVELTAFSVSQINSRIVLNWQTATEVNNYGFEVERRKIDELISQGINEKTQLLNGSTDQWLKIGFVSGNGTSNAPHTYTYSDGGLASGRYAYRLKQIDNSGTYKFSLNMEVDIPYPITYSLSQNYPNPFNPSTTIQYSLPKNSLVRIQIYNVLGQMVAELVNSEQASGYQSAVWNAKVASGMYFYRMEATDINNQNNRFVDIKKMLLLK